MSEERIEIGDMVRVTFGVGGEPFSGRVVSIPQATGDCWVIREGREGYTTKGKVHYVQTFLQIIKEIQ